MNVKFKSIPEPRVMCNEKPETCLDLYETLQCDLSSINTTKYA